MNKNFMRKTAAAKDSTTFDETVPSTSQQPNQFDGTQGQAQDMKKQKVDPASQNAANEYAAVPADQQDAQAQAMQMTGLPQEMIDAAHSFLGQEVLQAVSAGDPNAQDLYARTAAQLAANYMTMSANQAQQQMPVDASGAPVDASGMPVDQAGAPAGQNGAAPQGITSPEDDIASELVPNVNAMAQQQVVPQAGAQPATGEEQAPVKPGEAKPEGIEGKTPEQGGADQMVDIKTVAKLIQLAKQGHI